MRYKVCRTVPIVLCLCIVAAWAHAENKSGVEPQVISLPKGPGTLDGLGESFEPMLNTGTVTYEVKLTLPPGVNKHQPELSLVYDSGHGNSVPGIGWDLDIPFVQRQTDKGLPKYDGTDIFIYASSGELVPTGGGIYRMKIEGRFSRFIDKGDSWEVMEKNGGRLFFGESQSARVANGKGIFKWLLERSVDSNGNEIRYTYFQDGGQAYLGSIQYSIVGSALNSVKFDYEDRNDAFSDFRSGVEVTTAKRLKSIEVLNLGSLVRRYELSYDQNAQFSLLTKVTQFGGDGTSSLPQMTFTYSKFDLSSFDVVQMVNSPDISLKSGNADLVDINGDALPDVVYTPHDQAVKNYKFFINDGNGSFEQEPHIASFMPYYFLDSKNVQMADMNGDGLADLLVKSSTSTFGYYRSGNDTWSDSDWKECSPIPVFGFEDPDVKLLDLNNDGLIDVLKSDVSGQYTYWLNGKDCRWTADLSGEGPPYHFGDTQSRLKLGDMNGDGMEDLVYLGPFGISYFPSTGYGKYGNDVEISSLAFSAYHLQGEKLLLNDINNDGLCDLIYIMDGEITLWLNRGKEGLSAPVHLTGTPAFDPLTTAVRIADIDGDGLREILYSNRWGSIQYVHFNQGMHPNLLTGIDNGLGSEIVISYRSSTDYYLEARRSGNPWKKGMRIPFPVQVVSKRVVRDKNSGQEYVTDFSYRDGYYDATAREFRGFGGAEKIERGDPSAPSLKTHYVFDVGRVEESRKGIVLGTSTLTENGGAGRPGDTFTRVENALRTRNLASGTDGRNVRFSFVARTDTSIFERTATPKVLRAVFDYDQYGNQIKSFNYGEINGSDLGLGQDEILTTTQYYHFTDNGRWIVDRPRRILKTALDNHVLSETVNVYDSRGNLTAQKRWREGATWVTTRNVYDQYGNITKMIDADGRWRTIKYDSTFQSFPVSETIGKPGLTVRAAYDYGLGKLTQFTDFNRHVTHFRYDTFGRLVKIVKPGNSDLYPTQAFTYDLRDPVSSILTQSREASGKPGTYDTVSYFDGLGRKLQTRSEGEDGKWVVTDALTFNPRRQPKRKWLPYFDTTSAYGLPNSGGTTSAAPAYLTSFYDPTGRVTKEVNPDGSFRKTRYLPLKKEEWDEEDNHLTGPHAATPHAFTYDGLNRLVKVEERNGTDTYTTTYGYDGLDNLLSILDNAGNLKEMSFDGLARKVYMKDPDKGEMHYWYDSAGNLVKTLDNKGQTITCDYDEASRIHSENYNGIKVLYHYDADLPADGTDLKNTLGRLSYVEDEAGRIAFSYDPRGNTSLKARKIAGTGTQYDGYELPLGMTYDAMDRVRSLTYPDGMKVNYVYNAANQLESIPGYVNDIDYEASGQKSRFVYGNGVASRYSYDARQRLERLRTEAAGTAGTGSFLQDLSYTYDRVSNITAITDGRAQPTPESQSRTFAYDDLYRLTRAEAPGWYIQYGYDSIGNMVSQASDVGDVKVNLGVLRYGEGVAGPHAVTSAGAFEYGYDGNGNVKAKTGYVFEFDYKDRMTGANQVTGGLHGKYVYGYDGNRVIKAVTGGATSEATLYVDKYAEVRQGELIEYVFVGDRRVTRVSKPFNTVMIGGNCREIGIAAGEDSSTMKHFEETGGYEKSLVSGVMVGAQTYFYIPDHLGSASVLTDEEEKVVEESSYYPYGMDRARRGSCQSEYRFTGKELDNESEFHYFGARYYDAMIGRYLSVDPFYSEKSSDKYRSELFNLYCYTSNPIRFIDPNGLFLTDAVALVSSLADIVAPAISETTDKTIGWASNTSAGKWLGDQALKIIVGNDLKNADYAAQAAYYGALAEGLDKTIAVTKEATGVALQTATSIYTDGPQGAVSGMLQLGGILANTAGWEKTGNILNVASNIVSVGDDMHSIYEINKSWRSLDKIVKPDLLSGRAQKVLRKKEITNAFKASSTGMDLAACRRG